MVKRNTCIFISGRGTNLKNLISHSRSYTFPLKICLVIYNNKNAGGVNYAKKHKIPYIFIDTKDRNNENKILLNLRKHRISFICLAGYMKIISNNLIRLYQKKIINVHPSLLPKFKGLNTFARMLKSKEIKGGCTVHYVNEKLDSGSIIVQKKFFINTNDDVNILKKKTQKLEYKAFPEAIINMFRNFNY